MQWIAWLAATWITTPPPGVVSGLALHADSLFAGTDVGLFRSGATGWERAPFPGAVLALARDSQGIWAATPGLLWFWDGRSDPRSASLGVGARLRGVSVDSSEQVWAASEAGLFVRRTGRAGFERDATLPPGDVLAVRAAGPRVFAARSGALWRLRRGRFERLVAGLGEGWWELSAAVELGDRSYLAVPRGLWRVGPDGAERIDPGLVGEVHDVRASKGALLLASSRGVWRIAEPEGVDPDPVALLDANAERLLEVGDQIWAATDRGLARLSDPRAPLVHVPAARGEPVASIAAVRSAALEYLDLAPSALRRVEARARGRGWLPRVRAGVGSGRDRDSDRDWDEVVSSGEVRGLFDRHEGRDRDVHADLELVWDLDLLAAPDDAIAISRERRLVVELRDQVLERVNRIYFERLRVLDAAAVETDAQRRHELELRVAELAAQLDAWTGGRFSRLVPDSPPNDRREP